jgi:maltose phosphorylase
MLGQKFGTCQNITIDGDVKAQQEFVSIFSIEPNVFRKDSRLNIGPKGFTGEKYGGSTYWDESHHSVLHGNQRPSS